MKYFISALIGYGLGSISPSYIFAKKVGNVDIRKSGSKNAGASNTSVVLGMKYGVLTALIDCLKGVLSVLIAALLYGREDPCILYFALVGAVLGHIFPFYLGFHGGKGLATLVGTALSLNWKMALTLCLIMFIVTMGTNYVALGTVVVSISFFVYTVYTQGFMSLCTLLAGILMIVMIIKHISNYKRILNKEEVKFRSAFKKKK